MYHRPVHKVPYLLLQATYPPERVSYLICTATTACQLTLSQSQPSIAATCSDPPCDTPHSTLDPHRTLRDVWPNIMASQEEGLSELRAIISAHGKWLASSVVSHQVSQLCSSSKKAMFDRATSILPSRPRRYHESRVSFLWSCFQFFV